MKFKKVKPSNSGKPVIPKFFNILGQVFQVLIRPIDGRTIGGSEPGGECNASGIISIHPECIYEKSRADRLLVHEFIHGVLFRCELDALISDEVNEQITSQITTALLENWDMNPKSYLEKQKIPRRKKQPQPPL